ncbi:guanitoxin biosynthesis heme-dependent pre-guanitoxin N-hydroxylase GntA [Porphyrobacter sp. AAP82]|uniref:guanitoxin biosynthesis heme-dependent pre-guanitoxin N-hydroxylase GntA n=1 Tax=Porphyrobacter sp. AAP82 TaxID=1248917 RepID=UPI0002EFB068|nr:guanitoxin biosynthesis heme-dependent pre-guanitoxin N-hydroxylase GntA [Porphyrobacter sp. AAP82]
MNIEPRSFLAAEEAGAPADAPADASPLSPAGALAAHIEAADFPCVGAKSALAQDGLQVETARDITRGADDARIHRALARWSMLPADAAPEFRSLAVVFAGPPDLDERDFEAALWARLGSLAALDRAAGFAPEPGFSSDPADAHFALSFGGKAYFAVGLHPNASRRARRLPFPAIVFNLHEQFARLREEDRYERMREVILARDVAFNGAPNPMLARHGTISEARQYSGRAVEEGWVCPFAPERPR